jgi:hypothetical protein
MFHSPLFLVTGIFLFLLYSRWSWALHGLFIGIIMFSIASTKGERGSIPLSTIQDLQPGGQELLLVPGAAGEDWLGTESTEESHAEKKFVEVLDI